MLCAPCSSTASTKVNLLLTFRKNTIQSTKQADENSIHDVCGLRCNEYVSKIKYDTSFIPAVVFSPPGLDYTQRTWLWRSALMASERRWLVS